MELNKCIITAAKDLWYTDGQKRLVDSLKNNFDGRILQWTNEFPCSGYDEDNIYNIKASALEIAMKLDYDLILWADASMWAVKNVNPIFDVIEHEGFYVESNGFKASQECNDASLKYFGYTRDEADNIPMCSSGLLGINVKHEKGKAFAEAWIKSAKDGIFAGSRLHDNQSEDSRFLHHRQDQSCASLIIYKLGLKIYPLGTYMDYGPSNKENLIFNCRGL